MHSPTDHERPEHPSARRWLFVGVATLALAALVVLPWIGFRRLSAANEKTHDLTLVLAATNYTSSSITGALSGPVGNFEQAGRETDYQRVAEATAIVEEALLLLEEAFPAAERERVFGRFERLASARQTGGIGIGLHLSRELARPMGGDLSVAPSDTGTCTRLVLPRAATMREAA